MTPVHDVIAWRGRLAARLYDETYGTHLAAGLPTDPVQDERAQDALRPDHVRQAISSETPSSAARVLVPAYVDAAGSVLDRAARLRRAEALLPWNGDVDAALAGEPDDTRRADIEAAFRRALEGSAATEAERDAARDEAAHAIGCADELDARRRIHVPLTPAQAEELERGFVAPLDDVVAAHGFDLGRDDGGGVGGGTMRPCDVPRLVWQPDRVDIASSGAAVRWVRGTATTLRLDPDAGGMRLEHIAPAPPRPRVWEEIAPRAIVVAGSWGGPWGLALTLEAAGRAMHATFVRTVRGAHAWACADPAYGWAAAWLFRRIAASVAGPLARLDPEGRMRGRLAFEDLVTLRRALVEAPRAGARPLSTGESASRSTGDESSRVRGAILATLIEERLLSRYGRAWFDEPAAGHYLRDLWAAEPDGDPASMAAAWGLGTMDSSPLIEAFRLRKGREL
jgi:hypothetical protein